jgi:FMN phosphatase YigB (HAD superfamily)
MTQTNNIAHPLKYILDEALKVSKLSKLKNYVFDLDSTLLDVSPRIQQIINEFMKTAEIRTDYPEVLKQMQNIKVEPTDWGIYKSFERLQISNIPDCFIAKAIKYWREHFFANTYLHLDRPYEGASEFVQKMNSLGHRVFYLTGRDVHRMKIGTIESLKQHNFPIEAEKAQLILKPDKSMHDPIFKKDWFEHFIKSHPNEEFLFFENEPLNIEAVRHLHPIVQVIFFDSTHSGVLNSPQDLPVIQNFKL